jgi:hypothetical protein
LRACFKRKAARFGVFGTLLVLLDSLHLDGL